jgi:acyl-CoA thioesterase-2
VHSLHAYCIRAGDPRMPIIYDVDRIRDGRSFTTRRVVAIQHGKVIFSLSASFQPQGQGLEHADPMPEVARPGAVGRPGGMGAPCR